MSATRLFFCPDCEGAGEIVVRHYSGDPQLEEEIPCYECSERGHLRLTRAEGDARGLRPYTPSTRTRYSLGSEWLLVMAQWRRRAAALKRKYPRTDLADTEYGFARLCAMRPVAARLRQTDMLALARRCVTATERLRGAA